MGGDISQLAPVLFDMTNYRFSAIQPWHAWALQKDRRRRARWQESFGRNFARRSIGYHLVYSLVISLRGIFVNSTRKWSHKLSVAIEWLTLFHEGSSGSPPRICSRDRFIDRRSTPSSKISLTHTVLAVTLPSPRSLDVSFVQNWKTGMTVCFRLPITFTCSTLLYVQSARTCGKKYLTENSAVGKTRSLNYVLDLTKIYNLSGANFHTKCRAERNLSFSSRRSSLQCSSHEQRQREQVKWTRPPPLVYRYVTPKPVGVSIFRNWHNFRTNDAVVPARSFLDVDFPLLLLLGLPLIWPLLCSGVPQAFTTKTTTTTPSSFLPSAPILSQQRTISKWRSHHLPKNTPWRTKELWWSNYPTTDCSMPRKWKRKS